MRENGVHVGSRKTMKKSLIWDAKMEGFWGAESSQSVELPTISCVSAFMKKNENGAKMEFKMHQKSMKIELWARWGAFFKILGGFWRKLIFNGFLIGKKSAEKSENGGSWRQDEKSGQLWEGSAAEAVAAVASDSGDICKKLEDSGMGPARSCPASRGRRI